MVAEEFVGVLRHSHIFDWPHLVRGHKISQNVLNIVKAVAKACVACIGLVLKGHYNNNVKKVNFNDFVFFALLGGVS